MQTSASWAAASDRFNEAPVGYTVLVTLGLAALGFTFWKLEYGGLAGVYKKPEKLLVALNGEDNILVVDVRQDAELERDGMLDLKRQARGKAVHLPYVPVRPHLRACSFDAFSPRGTRSECLRAMLRSCPVRFRLCSHVHPPCVPVRFGSGLLLSAVLLTQSREALAPPDTGAPVSTGSRGVACVCGRSHVNSTPMSAC